MPNPALLAVPFSQMLDSGRHRQLSWMMWMRALHVSVTALSFLIFGSIAHAEPKMALIDALRAETSQTRQLTRDYIAFCRDTLAPSVSGRLRAQCVDRLNVLQVTLHHPTVTAELKQLRTLSDSATLGAILSPSERLKRSEAALPAYQDFLSALDLADR